MRKHECMYTAVEIERETDKDLSLYIQQLELQGELHELKAFKENLITIKEELKGVMQVDLEFKIHEVTEAIQRTEERIIGYIERELVKMRMKISYYVNNL